MEAFIGHAETDGTLARRVADTLSKAGLEVWDDAREIMPGDT